MPITQINGCSMHFSDRGDGTAIVFIHPPVLTSLNFHRQIVGLSTQFRTIAFDIRGHGHSESSAIALTYPLIVDDIKKLLDYLGIEQAYLCGYSTGGSIVLEFLLTHPERALGGIVVGGMSEVRDKRLGRLITLGRIFSRIGTVGVGIIALADAWSQANYDFGLFRRLFVDAKKANATNAEQYFRYSLNYNCTTRLADIHHPLLLLYGGKDKTFHPYAHLLQHHLPSSKLVFIDNVDHRIPTKAASQMNELIRQFVHDCEQGK